jgi:hypothetical protein
LARILSEPAVPAALPPCNGGDGRAPVAIELIHNVARPIRTLDELNREQQHLDHGRAKLLTK